MPRKRKELICHLHQAIQEHAESLLDMDNPTKAAVRKHAKKIIRLTEEALLAGQSMEDRLMEYYNGVISMGFERDKR